jgi:hypothetical protein
MSAKPNTYLEGLPDRVDPELKKTLESFGSRVAERSQQERQEQEKLPAKVIQLPLWPEARRGVPNDILRSALFAAIESKNGEYMEQRLIAAYDGVKIKYTGKQLVQSDLDVWEQLVHLARQHPLGTICCFTAHGFLKALGRSTGKAQYAWLKGVILRLSSCTVEICKDKQIYGRSLIEKFNIDEITRHFKIMIDRDIMAVYGAGWTAIDWEQRQQLRKKPLALWLHGYYSSHAAPLPVKVETLQGLCGSRAKTLRSYRQQLREALQELKAISAIEAWQIDDSDLVHADRGRAISASQQRHLTYPKARKNRRK